MRASVIVCCLAVASHAGAQLPSVRPIGRVDAVSKDSFSSLAEVRPLSDGRVLVNDASGQRLVILDRQLDVMAVVFDSLSPRPLTYPRGYTRLMAARGDTSLLTDQEARGLRVIDPAGKVVRREYLFNPNDAVRMLPTSGAAVDPLGRIVFAELQPPAFGRGVIRIDGGSRVVRIYFDTTLRDVVDSLRGATGGVLVPIQSSGPPGSPPRISIPSSPSPFYNTGDDWALMSDGAIAIVRTADYHVEWVELDGSRHQSRPVGWPWKVLSEAQKQKLSDSVQAARIQWQAERSSVSGPPKVVQLRPLPPGLPSQGPPISGVVPDTVPAIVPGRARGDRNDRIWVKEGPMYTGLPATNSIYDVIDKSGRIVDRIEFPHESFLAGFGPNGAVYFLRAKAGWVSLERTTLSPR